MARPTVVAMAERVWKADEHELTAMLADSIGCRLGDRREDPLLARQRLAGEEDQSVPGWDQGA